MSFKYKYTCPEIDKEIGRIKDTIEDMLGSYIEELVPLMCYDTTYKLKKQWSNEIYENIQSSIETIRETNEDMRTSAEKQISDLEEEIENLKDVILNLENER